MANWGALAGGVVDGMEIAERRRLNRGREARETERHQFDMGERYRQAESRDRQEAAWDELNAAIARRLQKQAPTQPATPQPAPTASSGEPIEQGHGVQTMPYRDDGAGLMTRTLPDDPSTHAGYTTRTLPYTPSATVDDDTALDRLHRPNGAGAPERPAGGGQGGQDAGRQIGFSLFQNPNLLRDPDFLNEAASIFMKARMPEGVKWLERGFTAQKENGIDAMKAFLAGDAQAGIAAYNASGREKIESARQITEGENKGRWEIRAQGYEQPIIVDPAAALRSYLDPKAFFELAAKEQEGKRKDAESAATVDERKARTRYYDSQAKAVTDNAASLADYRRTMGGAAERRVDQPRGGGGPPTPRQNAQLANQIDAQLRRQMRDTAPTNPTKPEQKLPNPMSEFVPDIREQIMTDVANGVDPNLAFNNRYVEWGEKFDQANEVLGQAFDKAKRAGSGMFKGREDSVKSLRESIAELEKQGISVEEQRRFAKAAKKDMQLFNEAAQGMSSGRVSRPAPAQAAGGAGGAPATPKTRAEVEALPSGARFINPADGRILVKK